MTHNIAVMRKNFDGTDWKRAFAAALIGLQPDMNPDRADEVSDSEYLRGRHVEPALAASRWVTAQTRVAAGEPDGTAVDRLIGPESSAA